MKRIVWSIVWLFFLVGCFESLMGEGSKEVYIGTYKTSIFLCNDFVGKCNSGGAGDRTQFAVYGCEETSRLYFATANNHEIVYLGLNVSDVPTTCHAVFRIKNLAGSIVYSQTNVPTSGTGFISTITQARNGPQQLYGTGGYPAINWHPPAPGTYYIEFQEVNNSSGTVQTDNDGFNIDLFDLTVYDSVALQKKLGRLYSKAWQYYEEGTHFSGTNYVYSIDSIITKAVFNDLRGGHWVQFCNQWGCQNTNNFLVDRKSLYNDQAYLPQYLQFLNTPDATLFPPGQVLGQIVPPEPWPERNCTDGSIIFHVTVNKGGNVEIDLDFPSPYIDRVLTATVTPGEDLIYWDGKDGAGTYVPNNIVFSFTVQYVNGLTNLPLYDVEGNPNGFTVNIVAPSGSAPLVYWDDTNITTGGSNLVGCSSPPGGCHWWTNPFGDHNTINTWWYNVSSTTTPVQIVEWRKPGALTINQQPPQSYCAGTNGVSFSVTPDANTEQYHWSYTGTGATILQANPADPFITVNFSMSATSGTIQVYGSNTNCTAFNGPTSSLAVTIKPAPSLNAPFAKSICTGSNTAITLTSTPSGALFSWATPPPTCSSNIVACPTGSINATAINDLLSVNNLASGSVVYHLTGTLNGCTGPTTDYTVTVNPIPNVVINSTTPNLCSGQTTNIQLSSSVTGATFTWTATGSSPNVSGFSNGSGSSISQTLTVSNFAVATVTYAITPSMNGCSPSTPTNYVVTVNPLPNLSNSPPATTICSGQSTNVLLTSNVAGTTFTWNCTASSTNLSGYSANSLPTNILNQTIYNSGVTTETVYYHVTPQINSCVGTSTDFIVTVNPIPQLIMSPMSQSICSDSTVTINLAANMPCGFTFVAQLNSGNVTGFSSGGGSVIQQTLHNQIASVGIVNYTIYCATASCMSSGTNYPVTVYPVPQLMNTPPSSIVCNNQIANIQLLSNIPGATFTWTATSSSPQVGGYSNNTIPASVITDQLTNSSSIPQTVTYHVTASANGCPGISSDFIVTVNPTPDVSNNPLSQQQCSHVSTDILLTSHVSGTTFTWTATGSSGQVTGFRNTTKPATFIHDTLVNSSSLTQTVTYTLTPQMDDCSGTPVVYTVTVLPSPNLSNSPASQRQCNHLATGITLTSNVAGTLFTWTATGSSGQVTGFTNNLLPTTTLNQTLHNSGYNTEVVTYEVTPQANGCTGMSSPFAVTVDPTPDLSNTPTTLQICNNMSPNVTLTSHVAGTAFTWTATGSSPSISGYSNNSTPTTLLDQTLSNASLVAASVTYSIIPHVNGCDGNPTPFIVNVAQSPDVYFVPNTQTICSAQTTTIAIQSSVPSASFSWVASSSSALVTGFSNGSGASIQQVLTNGGTTIETVTYTVTPSVSGCPSSNTGAVVVTVNPTPVIINTTTSSTQCSSTNTNIVPQSGVSGTTYAWNATGSSATISGYSSGSGLTINQLLVNSGFTTEQVTYSVTPTANGCLGAARLFTASVYPVADVYFTPPTQALCSAQTCNITTNSHVAGALFSWTATGSSGYVSGFSDGSGTTIQQTLTNSSYSIETVNYTVTPRFQGCIGTAGSVSVTVHPSPVVSFTPCFDQQVTKGTKPFKIGRGLPFNGTYSGVGLTGTTFNPSVAGVGTFTLSYHYSNSYGCSSSATQTITVVNNPTFTCGNTLVDIRDNKSYPTVQIGSQCWMASNLDFGSEIAPNLDQRDNCISEKYSNSTSLVPGIFYQWDELMRYTEVPGGQGLCPAGWHIPTESEWSTLFLVYLSNGFAGSPLKYSGYSGFNAFLTGARHESVVWSFIDFAGMFWSSTTHSAEKAWAHGMNTYDPSVSNYPSLRTNAFSVRCIKD